jgi:thiol-disulfide isomerase/thioredoxin
MIPTKLFSYALVSGVVLLGLSVYWPAQALLSTQTAEPAPEFTHSQQDEWINSAPLTLESLRGQVVLLDFWTFDCWNCYRSFPWLTALEKRLAKQGLRVIGVHTPEFKHERVRANIEAKVKEFGLQHPTMMDNDFSYWRAMNNRYWPAFYLIDKQSRLRAQYAGETHAGDQQAQRIEADIRSLLAE